MFPALPLMISFLLGALKSGRTLPDAVKNDTYECGVETEGDSWVQFNFKLLPRGAALRRLRRRGRLPLHLGRCLPET